MDSITITGGYLNGESGAGIRNDGALILNNVSVSDNVNGQGVGGAINNFGSLWIYNSTLSGNEAT